MNATTVRSTAGSRRIRRWPSPSVVTRSACGQSVDQRDRVGVRRLPVAAVVHDERRHRVGVRGLEAGVELRDRQPDERVGVLLERAAGPRAEAEGALELVDQRRGLDHRREQHQPSGAEPAVPDREVRRDGAERVRDHRVRGAEAGARPRRAPCPSRRRGCGPGRPGRGRRRRGRARRTARRGSRPRSAARRSRRAGCPGRPSRGRGRRPGPRPRRGRGPRRPAR